MSLGDRTMYFNNGLQKIVGILVLTPFIAFAQTGTQTGAESETLESDWLELVKGYRGSALGTEIVKIEDGDSPATQEITLTIPKDAIGDTDAIEEVIVIGRMPEKPEPLDITYEWLQDYDKDNYGLVIRLGKNTNWPIRLYMNSNPGFVR
jgi:hypothetical protein